MRPGDVSRGRFKELATGRCVEVVIQVSNNGRSWVDANVFDVVPSFPDSRHPSPSLEELRRVGHAESKRYVRVVKRCRVRVLRGPVP